MPWETAVVDGRFYAWHPTEFTVASRPRDGSDFAVTEIPGGAAAMRVEAFSHSGGNVEYGGSRNLRFFDPASTSRYGRPVFTVEEPLSGSGYGRRRFEAFWGGSTRRRDLLFSAVEEYSYRSGTELHVFLAGNRREREPDFAAHCGGNYYARGGTTTMTVSRGGAGSGAAVALITRDWKNGTAALKVKPRVDHAFVIALAVILEEMHNYGQPRRRPPPKIETQSYSY